MEQKQAEKTEKSAQPLLTVIVPVYQTKKYIWRCIYSLLSQTCRDLEILLVDDGSTDGSGEICDLIGKKDTRIRVIHQKNGGLSCARNAGLREAKGLYVGFVDSDDAVETTMFEELLQAACQNQADIVMCDHRRIFVEKGSEKRTTSLPAGIYRGTAIQTLLYPALLMGRNLNYGPLLQVWNCVYRRSFLDAHGIWFAPEIKWSEDNLFNAMAGYHADCFVYLKGRYLYRYYQNPGSITTAYRPGAWAVYKKMNAMLTQYFEPLKEIDFSTQLDWHLLYYACHVIGMEVSYAKNIREACKRIKAILTDPQLKAALHRVFARKHAGEECEKLNIPAKLWIQLGLMRMRAGLLLVITHVI